MRAPNNGNRKTLTLCEFSVIKTHISMWANVKCQPNRISKIESVRVTVFGVIKGAARCLWLVVNGGKYDLHTRDVFIGTFQMRSHSSLKNGVHLYCLFYERSKRVCDQFASRLII